MVDDHNTDVSLLANEMHDHGRTNDVPNPDRWYSSTPPSAAIMALEAYVCMHVYRGSCPATTSQVNPEPCEMTKQQTIKKIGRAESCINDGPNHPSSRYINHSNDIPTKRWQIKVAVVGLIPVTLSTHRNTMITIGKFVEDCRAKGIDCTYEGTRRLFATTDEEFEEVDADVGKVFVRESDSIVQYDVIKKRKPRSLEFDFDEGVWRVLDGEQIKKEFVFAEIKEVSRGENDPRQVRRVLCVLCLALSVCKGSWVGACFGVNYWRVQITVVLVACRWCSPLMSLPGALM